MRNPFRGRRRLLILAAVAAGLAAGTFLAMHYGIPYRRHWAIQRQLAAFKADPTQANAEPLVLALYHHDADPQENAEIIQTLLDLKVEARPSYAPNEPIYVTLASGNTVHLQARLRPEEVRAEDPPPGNPTARLLFMGCSNTLYVPGLTPSDGHLNSESVQFDPSLSAKLRVDGSTGFLAVPGTPEVPQPAALAISKPGTYPGCLVFECWARPYANIEATRNVVVIPADSTSLLSSILARLGFKPDPLVPRTDHILTIKVPFEIRIAELPAGAAGTNAKEYGP